MLKRRLLLLALTFVVAGVSACIFDPPKDDPGDDPPPPTVNWDNLTEREHVVTNMEKAYNARRIDKYDELLDASFVSFFAPGDVGGEIPEQWDRATEITTNTVLFDKTYNGEYACQKIDMDIRTEDGISWTSSSTNGETWYTASLNYEFTFEIAPDTYVSQPGMKADFTVRNAGTPDAPQWRLVEFRDWGLD